MYVILLSHIAEEIPPIIRIHKGSKSSLGWVTHYGGKICVATRIKSRQISKNVPYIRIQLFTSTQFLTHSITSSTSLFMVPTQGTTI
jgi:hypothetical protein